MSRTKQKGSITLEAAIVLPVFVLAVVSILSVIKVIFTMDMMSYAINETADQIAALVYPAHALGYRVNAGTGTDGGNALQTLVDAGGSLDGIISCLQLISDSTQIENETTDKAGSGRGLDEVISEYLLALIRKELQDKAEEAFLNLMIDLCLPQYIEESGISESDIVKSKPADADRRLRQLGISGGYEGLDFSESKIFDNGADDVEVTVVYKIKLPAPFLFRAIIIRQTAVSRAWLGGDEPSPPVVEDIWSLDNLTRGKRIRELFGGNLPFSFPGLSAYKNGKATLIRSMDTTAASYQTAEKVEAALKGYVDEIAEYPGQQTPWGSDKIVIMPEGISIRELIFVIPENEISAEVQSALQLCRSYADERSVSLRIIRYGTKKAAALIESDMNN